MVTFRTRPAAASAAVGMLIVTAACAGGSGDRSQPGTAGATSAPATHSSTGRTKTPNTTGGSSTSSAGRAKTPGTKTPASPTSAHKTAHGNKPGGKASTSATPSKDPAQGGFDPINGGKKSDKPVIAVKIDNVAAARPQVGIDRADMIVAERVESDLTRLLAIYHSEYPKRVGPVRSARNTDLRLLGMFDKPGLVFSGANRKVMKQVRKAPVRPIKRSSRDHSRTAPHNVMVNLDRISQHVDGIGKAQSIGYTFDRSAPVWKGATSQSKPKIKIGHDTFGFSYRNGKYRTRWNGHRNTDGDSHKPVSTDNIVRLHVSSHKDTHTTSTLSNVAETVGSGRATIYSGGKKLNGRWSRGKKSKPMQLKNSDGKKIPLRPGRTWVMLDG